MATVDELVKQYERFYVAQKRWQRECSKYLQMWDELEGDEHEAITLITEAQGRLLSYYENHEDIIERIEYNASNVC